MQQLNDNPGDPVNLRSNFSDEFVTPFELPVINFGQMGSYQLIERLGEGGMGEVFQAVHIGLGRVVALKRIRAEKLQTPSTIRRFLREVRATARVDHPNIVRAYDANSEEDSHYLVMEFIDGTDLKSFVKKNGPMPVEDVLRVALEISLALQHLHSKCLIHRDIKPSNIIRVRETGVNKLMDLGLARFLKIAIDDSLVKSITLRGTILGTPDYMAPEQVMNAKNADIRSDLYSLGCTMYFLLTGSVPFPTPVPVQKLMKQIEETPPSILQFRPNLPVELVRFVERLMAKSPNDRPQTPSETLIELQAFTLKPVVETTSHSIIHADSINDSEKGSVDFWQQQFREWAHQKSTVSELDLKVFVRGFWRNRKRLRMMIAVAIIMTVVAIFSLLLLVR